MPEWIPGFAMPNVQPQNAIEIDGIVFVSVFDPRIQALRTQHPNYDAYLNQISDKFWRQVEPQHDHGARRYPTPLQKSGCAGEL
jgi:hypothetical protein